MSSIPHDTPNHLVLYNVPWNAYTRFMDGLGQKRLPHVYQNGTLEMMSPDEDHESLKGFLGRLIGATAIELGVDIRSVGSATRRHQKLKHAFEPDESYYVGVHAAASRKRSAAANKRGVPDLVIEIEWSRAQLAKLDSYAVLGVREVWRYHKGKVEFYVLSKDGTYQPVDRSDAFPLVAKKDLTRLVNRLAEDGENALVVEFVAHLRKLRKA